MNTFGSNSFPVTDSATFILKSKKAVLEDIIINYYDRTINNSIKQTIVNYVNILRNRNGMINMITVDAQMIAGSVKYMLDEDIDHMISLMRYLVKHEF